MIKFTCWEIHQDFGNYSSALDLIQVKYLQQVPVRVAKNKLQLEKVRTHKLAQTVKDTLNEYNKSVGNVQPPVEYPEAVQEGTTMYNLGELINSQVKHMKIESGNMIKIRANEKVKSIAIQPVSLAASKSLKFE